jgi:HEAT repeat protein
VVTLKRGKLSWVVLLGVIVVGMASVVPARTLALNGVKPDTSMAARKAREHIIPPPEPVRKVSEEEFQRLLKKVKEGKAELNRSQAALELTRIGDPRAVPTLCEAVRTDSVRLVRSDIIKDLGVLGDRRAVPCLVEAMREDPDIRNRYLAASILAEDFGEKEVAMPTLFDIFMKKGFEKEDWEKVLNRPDLPDSLRMRLVAESPHRLMWRALVALEKIGGPEVIARLDRATESEDSEVREAAKGAVKRLMAKGKTNLEPQPAR